jgi:uncharacterized glyoxalase superfamily protein PhnB
MSTQPTTHRLRANTPGGNQGIDYPPDRPIQSRAGLKACQMAGLYSLSPIVTRQPHIYDTLRSAAARLLLRWPGGRRGTPILMISVSEGASQPNGRHAHVTRMRRGKEAMKLALVTIVTANLEPMRTFYQEVLQIAPQTYRGNYVEFGLEAGTLALWRQSETEAFGIAPMRGAANHSVLLEFAVEDVDREYDRLKDLQIEWVQELTTQPWGHRAFYVRDPDGNILNFHTAVEEPSC